MKIGTRIVQEYEPAYVIAEIGINHNGSRDLALQMVDAAHASGCDAVKFQKRDPETCVPRDQWEKQRETPWGQMSYIDYKRRIEFGEADYSAIALRCEAIGIDWFVSCWDAPSVELIERFEPVAHKIASASITDDELLDSIAGTGRPVIMSTGMSEKETVNRAFGHTVRRQGGTDNIALLHTTSSYPCPDVEVNLRAMMWLKHYGVPVGYSGHEHGIHISEAAVALGACIIERHFTIDRSMWGTDQAASLEPPAMAKLVRNIRGIERAMGDGEKRVMPSEVEPMKKLRKVV